MKTCEHCSVIEGTSAHDRGCPNRVGFKAVQVTGLYEGVEQDLRFCVDGEEADFTTFIRAIADPGAEEMVEQFEGMIRELIQENKRLRGERA
ncbi:MAG TPA: hypothetical protein VM366_16000 [Anaerolineae bacterium]|nr:hypothetical protein [Anaerolineae bacterium]